MSKKIVQVEVALIVVVDIEVEENEDNYYDDAVTKAVKESKLMGTSIVKSFIDDIDFENVYVEDEDED